MFYLVFLFEMSVKCLDKSSFMITEVAFPGFMVAVVPVHVVHQTPEPLALLPAQLAHAELLVVLRNLLLCVVTQGFLLQKFLWGNNLLWSSSFPFERHCHFLCLYIHNLQTELTIINFMTNMFNENSQPYLHILIGAGTASVHLVQP